MSHRQAEHVRLVVRQGEAVAHALRRPVRPVLACGSAQGRSRELRSEIEGDRSTCRALLFHKELRAEIGRNEREQPEHSPDFASN